MRTHLPSYIPLMMIITALYLTVEIPFSVHLISVMGGNPSQADIDNIEMIGRIMTGIAVSIFVVGVWVFPKMRDYHIVAAFLVAVAIGSGTTCGTFIVLEKIAELTGSESTSEERREAFISNIAKRHISENGVGELQVFDAGEWSTFTSVLPILTSSDRLIQMTGRDLEDMARKEAARMMGTHSQFKDAFFGKSFDVMRDSYDAYVEGSKARWEGMREANRGAQREWERYLGELRRKRMAKDEYRADERAEIRRQLHREGLNMPKNWHPTDYDTFMKIAAAKAKEKVEKEYKRRIEREAGGYIPAGLSFDDFIAHAVTQKNLRKKLDLSAGKVKIVPTMSDADFVRQVYEPRRVLLEKELLEAIKQPHQAFADGAKFEDFGVNAVKAIRIPVMAILLSIAGAVLHVFKISGYITQAFGHVSGIRRLYNPFGRFTTAGLATISAFGFMFMSGNSVTASETFQKLDTKTPFGMVLTGAIGIQPEFSTLAEALQVAGPWILIEEELLVRVAFPNTSVANTALEKNDAEKSDGIHSLDALEEIPIPTWRPS